MKNRVLFLAIFSFVAIAAQAQTPQQLDTFHMGERHPCYYYWDTNWWDHFYLNYTMLPEYRWIQDIDSDYYPYLQFSGSLVNSENKQEVARYIYTDSTLTVIGVAAVCMLVDMSESESSNGWMAEWDSTGTFLPEYFRIYKPTTDTITGVDEMTLLAEARWDTSAISSYMIVEMQSRYWYILYPPEYGFHEVPIYYPVREAYFPEPVVITDSFYVSGTTNNTFVIRSDTSVYGPRGPHSPKVDYIRTMPFTTSLRSGAVPIPPYYKVRCNLDGEGPWHIRNDSSFLNIFPILDTSHHSETHDTAVCPTPTSLRTLTVRSDQVLLGWDSYGNDSWELAVWAEDGMDGEPLLFPAGTMFLALSDLDSARCYFACVRTVCEEGMKSAWSDTIRFCMPADSGEGDVAVSTIEEQTTQLMPNPASGKVTVYSSFRIATVEVFSMKGERMMKQTVDGLATTIDVSSLPAGAYMVRIDTNRGTVYKKLIVQ